MNNFYDFQIDNVDFACETPFESINDVYAYAKKIKASFIRQNYSDCTPWMRKVIGEYGEWLSLDEFEAALYEYNHK